MRRLVLSTAALTLLVSQSYGQQSSRRSCTTQYIPESCTQPPTNQSAPDTSTPQSVPDEGGFAAPHRTGTAAGETRSFGIEGFGVHIPSMSIRMPTLQLPGIVRYRREPRMLIDSSEAPFVRQSTRELTVPAGDNLVRQSAPDNSVPQSAPDNSTRQSSPDGCTRGVGMSQPEIMPPDAPVPPQPARAGVYPNFGAIQASPDAQVVQDPQTGRFYRVVLQPMPMQSVMVQRARATIRFDSN